MNVKTTSFRAHPRGDPLQPLHCRGVHCTSAAYRLWSCYSSPQQLSSCHPERPKGVEGSTHQFTLKQFENAKIPRLHFISFGMTSLLQHPNVGACIARPGVSITNLGKKKTATFRLRSLCWRYLSSRAVARQVLSAQMSLTSVFGMGTGGPSLQSTPTLMDGF